MNYSLILPKQVRCASRPSKSIRFSLNHLLTVLLSSCISDVLAFPLARSRNGAVGKRTSIHWTLVVVLRPIREVWHLCSLHGEDGPCGEYASAASMCAQFLDSLHDRTETERCSTYTRSKNKIFGCTVPKQPDSSSCGAYVCHFLDIIEKNRGALSGERDAKDLRSSIYAAFLANQVQRRSR